jgi:hypothetical protein
MANRNYQKKVLDKSPNLWYNTNVPRERKIYFMKEVVIMATKKTVVQMYEEVLALCVTDEQKAFIEKRIEITKNKNASKNTEPTPKQKEKMAADAAIENAILGTMAEGVQYTPSDLLKIIPNLPADYNTQRLTPRLTALVTNGKVAKATVKGRSVYSIVVE